MKPFIFNTIKKVWSSKMEPHFLSYYFLFFIIAMPDTIAAITTMIAMLT